MFGDYYNIGKAGRGPTATAGDVANRVDGGFYWACACGDVVGPGVRYCDQSCPLHLTIETPCGPVWFTMSFIVLPSAGDVVIFGQKTSWDKLGIDVMAQLQALVLKAEGREDGPEMELTDCLLYTSPSPRD